MSKLTDEALALVSMPIWERQETAKACDVMMRMVYRIRELETGLREALDLHPPRVDHLEQLLKG